MHTNRITNHHRVAATRVLRVAGAHWRLLVLVLTPLVLLPVPLVDTGSAPLRCAYIMLLMAVYWIVEAIPIPVTALLPMFMMPLLDLLPSKLVAVQYMSYVNVLLMGGLIMAQTIEKAGLHRRIALTALHVIGTRPPFLYLGFMLPTWLLSMWISNTATTSMMCTISDAVLQQLEELEIRRVQTRQQSIEQADATTQPGGAHCGIELRPHPIAESAATPGQIGDEQQPISVNDSKTTGLEAENAADNAAQLITTDSAIDINQRSALSPEFVRFSKGLTLCIPYAASIGGTTTLTGTAPTLVMFGIVEKLYGVDTGLNFATFMGLVVPITLVCVIVAWLVLCAFHLKLSVIFKRQKSEHAQLINRVIDTEYRQLGPIRFQEGSALFLLILLIVLWVSREPGIPLWGRFFTKIVNEKKIKIVNDAQPAIFVAFLCLIWPAANPFKKKHATEIASATASTPTNAESERLMLPWKYIERNFPWGVLFLIGGGFALAKSAEKSGLSELIGQYLTDLNVLPVPAMVLLIALIVSFLTEITSNTATSSIVVPIVANLANCSQIHPFLLIVPTTVACSFAFCLPVATPPNAIVFSQGRLKIIDMAKVGLLLNIVCVLILVGGIYIVGPPMFLTNQTPVWMLGKCNSTKSF